MTGGIYGLGGAMSIYSIQKKVSCIGEAHIATALWIWALAHASMRCLPMLIR